MKRVNSQSYLDMRISSNDWFEMKSPFHTLTSLLTSFIANQSKKKMLNLLFL